MAEVGHNSGAVARDQLRALVERVERLEEEKAALAADIREVYAEAKAYGFDTKTLRRIVRDRRKERTQLQEERAVYDLYASALSMLE